MEPLPLGVLAGLTPAGVDVRLLDDRIDEIDYDEPTDLVAINDRDVHGASRLRDRRRVPCSAGPGGHGRDARDADSRRGRRARRRGLHRRRRGAVGAGGRRCARGAAAAALRRRASGRRSRARCRAATSTRARATSRCPCSSSAAAAANRCEYCAVSEYFGHTQQHAPGRRGRGRDPGAAAARPVLRRRQPRREPGGSQGAPPRARPAQDPLGLPGERRPVARPGAAAPVGRERLPRQRDRLREPGPGESAPDAQGAQPAPGSTATREAVASAARAITCRRGRRSSSATTTTRSSRSSRPATGRSSNRFTFAAFNVLMPYPSTPLYARLKAEGRLLYDGRWWLHPEYRFNHAAFRPARMTADELTEAAWACRRRWSSPASICERAFDPHTNLASLVAVRALLCVQPALPSRGVQEAEHAPGDRE